jgi:hypothetical protein
MTDQPTDNTKFVVYREIANGNRCFSNYVPSVDATKSLDGTVAYTVLGYADDLFDAQSFLYGRALALKEKTRRDTEARIQKDM